MNENFSHIRGFNYQPSYGSTSMENWLYFKPDLFELELRRGIHFFPKMNAVRLWLSWDAYIRNPNKFKIDFDNSLKICCQLGLGVIPTLFNRWHDTTLDCGGIYVDHFMSGWSWVTRKEWEDGKGLFTSYLEEIVGGHAKDDRILIWDICNEPFSYLLPVAEMKMIEEAEYAWLERMYRNCKELGAQAPLGISIHPSHGRAGIERIEPISDVLLIHPYYLFGTENTEEKHKFECALDDYIEVSRLANKALLVTEACWGSLDDKWRVENIRYTLQELKKRGMGWLVHLLHHSLVADAHRPEFGPVGDPGNLAFIEADGSLRKGHDVFNEY
jgi:hypothetical protein